MLLQMFNVKNRRAGKVRGTKIKSDEKGRGNRKKVMSPGDGGRTILPADYMV